MRWTSVVVAYCLAACSPVMDWREIRPEGTSLTAMFPCKPSMQSRRVSVASIATEMTMYACTAQATVFAVSHADVGDPAAVNDALAALVDAARGNVDGVDRSTRAASVPGMTPYRAAAVVEILGAKPDGVPVVLRTAVFAHGTRVFQASMHGAQIDAGDGDAFFGALRLPR